MSRICYILRGLRYLEVIVKNSILYPILAIFVMLLGFSFYKIHKLEVYVGSDKPIVPMAEVKLRFDRGRQDAIERVPPAETEFFYLKGYGFAVEHDL